MKFSPAVKAKTKQTADNPKRRQRNARKQLSTTGIGTKSQPSVQSATTVRKNESKVLFLSEKHGKFLPMPKDLSAAS